MNKVVYFCFKLLGDLSPIYLGNNIPLEPYTRGRSTIAPSIWNLSGASLNILGTILEINPGMLEKEVEKGEIMFYGPYVADNEALSDILRGNKPRTIYVPLYKPLGGTIQSPRISHGAVATIEVRPMGLGFSEKGLELVYAVLNTRTGRINSSNEYQVISDKESRIGIALERRIKVVNKRKGSIYSYTGLRNITLCNGYSCITPSYCIEATLPKDMVNKLQSSLEAGRKNKYLIDIGGKQSAGSVIIAVADQAITELTKKEGMTRLAVSHIGILPQKEKIVSTRCERIIAYHGEIGLLTGWSYRENKQKTPIPTLMPGTIYESQQEECNPPRYWAHKLLATSIPFTT
ncbi:hypothetical protein PYJP_06400 [Pyrofollis japonicus]|uniref:hypothetical protein n=1 Tax=Pyrofollis japonicus TaxID=3060460 RepID=UPI00295A7089|nr:hypothetical protein [Pyrofollis japonicus]BEP17288.1 hypothetical protein PYJP_06400 [Pyrofollis japonicus]